MNNKRERNMKSTIEFFAFLDELRQKVKDNSPDSAMDYSRHGPLEKVLIEAWQAGRKNGEEMAANRILKYFDQGIVTLGKDSKVLDDQERPRNFLGIQFLR
jgi:hypothetical protein